MILMTTFSHPGHLREVLRRRSPSHRFAIPVDGTGLCPQCRRSVNELRDRGLAVQLDQAWMNGRDVYVYLLTPRGVAFCAEQRIGMKT
jgi:hypothetical protein